MSNITEQFSKKNKSSEKKYDADGHEILYENVKIVLDATINIME